MAVAVAIAAAVMVPAAIRHAEDAFDRADSTADTGTDCTSDHAAHGPGCTVTFIGAFPGAAHDALRVHQLRQRQPGERQCEDGEHCEHGRQSLRRAIRNSRRLSLGLQHRYSLRFAVWPTGRNSERRSTQMVATM